MSPKEPLINCLYGRIVALRGARNLDYPVDISRFLRSVRLVLHPAQTINQRFPNIDLIFKMTRIIRANRKNSENRLVIFQESC